jgi:hypothetical protein
MLHKPKNTDLKTLDIVAKSSQALSLLNEPKNQNASD